MSKVYRLIRSIDKLKEKEERAAQGLGVPGSPQCIYGL